MEYQKIAVGSEQTTRGRFNKYRILYSVSRPAVCTVSYRLQGTAHEETCFLEAGERREFVSFIDGYLQGSCGTALSEIAVNSKDFTLHSVETEEAELCGDVVFIENNRFRIGADVSWGGGLCCIEDRNNRDAALGNLLNRCDAGRLVQQSYYGIMGEPYECARFNNSVWSYNPVQGGDQYANKSKLIDLRVSEDRIYVKCRPMDWAQNNRPTPSYMENTYTVTEEYIRVDNRFVDFSGYTHRMSHQELPAFYVVSYLDHFVMYDGVHPWTGEPIAVKKDLNFWGDPRYAKDCYFSIKEGNTETWCAWVSGETGFGVGLYTPGAELLLAGRHAYNASKDPQDGATNYVAPISVLCLRSFEPMEYSYLITTGETSSIRQTFMKHRDFCRNTSFGRFKSQTDKGGN